MTPFDRVVAALKHQGLMQLGKPICPTCPPNKRRGFSVSESKTALGAPSVLIHCFRGCDVLDEIVPALGLDPAELFDGGQRVLFDGGRYCRVTTQGWKALPRSAARTFGIAASIGFYTSTHSPITLLRTPAQWDAVRREADLKDRRLREQVETWIACNMAHRCDRGILALYRAPFDRCPNCGRLTLEDQQRREVGFVVQTLQVQQPTPQVPTTTRKYAGNGRDSAAFRHASDTTHETAEIPPQSGRDSAASPNGRDSAALPGAAR